MCKRWDELAWPSAVQLDSWDTKIEDGREIYGAMSDSFQITRYAAVGFRDEPSFIFAVGDDSLQRLSPAAEGIGVCNLSLNRGSLRGSFG